MNIKKTFALIALFLASTPLMATTTELSDEAMDIAIVKSECKEWATAIGAQGTDRTQFIAECIKDISGYREPPFLGLMLLQTEGKEPLKVQDKPNKRVSL